MCRKELDFHMRTYKSLVNIFKEKICMKLYR
jgi:hypothetical protein